MENDVRPAVSPTGMTSSKSGTFYFAYGSNLSPTQMSLRLQANPSSSKPIAIARLDAHAWIICERGYANVVALKQSSGSSEDSVTWGVLYNLSSDDEARLDLFEGHDERRNARPATNPDLDSREQVPYLQGPWDYNKHYVVVTVTRWLRDPNDYGVIAANRRLPSSVRVLVYVDEFRTEPGPIQLEYIGRMNRAIRESLELGMPRSWVDAVMRRYVPPDIEVEDESYVGTDKGYIEA